MPKLNFGEVVEEICNRDTRYNSEVYTFVRESLDHTLKSLKRTGSGVKSHVTGQELLEGLRSFALKEYGPMSKAVLNEWGVKGCEDFGQIVFNLVNAGILGKTDADSPNDFKNGFSFDDAFVRPFEPRRDETVAKRPASRPARKKSRPGSGKANSAGAL